MLYGKRILNANLFNCIHAIVNNKIQFLIKKKYLNFYVQNNYFYYILHLFLLVFFLCFSIF